MRRTCSFGISEESSQGEWVQIRDDSPSPERNILERDLWEAVKTEMLRLPLVYREAMELRYVAHLSLTDTADRLGVTVATVKSRQFRGGLELRWRMIVGRYCQRKRLP